MSDDSEVVHELLMGEQPFAIIADAIRILTVERLKFQRLKDVIIEVINSRPKPTKEQLKLFAGQLPLDGRVRIYLRLSRPLNARLDEIKTDLSERLGDQCGVRETVVFCALVISQR
ncbi:MAG: hypothetical protein CMN74_12035 [Sphingorhabdus sp.]|nr:hypothetical protein [Sphingorhabdus sp.]|tara:strand:- start:54 stop:401 length:348 start_codon:yes stop_codon:yes gene_type:complete